MMVSLDDFVSETLRQLIAGVKKAQIESAESGAAINPSTIAANKEAVQVVLDRHGGMISQVNFDIAVTTQEQAGAKAGIGVFSGILGIGSQVNTDASSHSTNRIQFSIPIKFPDPFE